MGCLAVKLGGVKFEVQVSLKEKAFLEDFAARGSFVAADHATDGGGFCPTGTTDGKHIHPG